jgi:hypothetical protein
MKPIKSVWVRQPETQEDDQHRLLMQECAVYLFIITKLNSGGNFDHADQYTANAVMQGKRKTVARAIDRLITKGCVTIVAKGPSCQQRPTTPECPATARGIPHLGLPTIRGHFERDVHGENTPRCPR